MLKLLHRLHHPVGSSWAPWVRQHVDVHTLEGELDGAHWDGLRSLLPAYRQITCVPVNNGASTALWEDNWIGGAPLCSAFPVLYSHVAKMELLSKQSQEMGWPATLCLASAAKHALS